MSKKKQPAAIYMNIDDLYPAPDNPRVNDHVVDKVVRSIQLHGFAAPIVANLQGEILAGHTRWKAGKKIGMEKVPVRQMDLTGDQARLYRIADNKLSEFADWDEGMLKEQLANLEKAFPVDIADLFTDDELEEILTSADQLWSDALDALPEGEKSPYQQMTFSLHDMQAEVIQESIKLSNKIHSYADFENTNKNANALTRICEVFLSLERKNG
tara:strand:+ start:214 stop:852 length:639 start_codon:yes stop_codon:yes gene_type:complete